MDKIALCLVLFTSFSDGFGSRVDTEERLTLNENSDYESTNAFLNNLLAKMREADNLKNLNNNKDFSIRSYPWDSDYKTRDEHDTDSDDSMSIIWYIASFSGLIVFFLLVSCSEWCCRKHIRMPPLPAPQQSAPVSSPAISVIQESAPPAYDLFAPPSYDSLAANSNKTSEKSEYDVYVVPVHAISSMLSTGVERPHDEPPSYSAVNLSYVPDGETQASSA